MTLRINPTITRVWRSPTSLQYGIDEPLAMLERVGVGEERMLELLAVGTPRTGLDAIGSEHGLTSLQVREFVEAVTPALVHESEVAGTSASDVAAGARARITLTGTSPTSDHLATALSSEGYRLTRVDDPGEQRETLGDFGIAVGHFVLDPGLHSAWLRHDVPHLPIVWGDREVRIGPIIEPGHGPCLYCLDRARTDADPAWPAIAGQLWGRKSPLESPLLAADAAVTAARLVIERLSGSRGPAQSTAIDATGQRILRTHVRHPECGCHGWGEVVSLPRSTAVETTPGRVRRETAMATARRAATSATRSREDAAGRA